MSHLPEHVEINRVAVARALEEICSMDSRLPELSAAQARIIADELANAAIRRDTLFDRKLAQRAIEGGAEK